MQELDRRVQNDVPLTPAESRAWMRWAGHLPPKKRKKRRKRKLPRNSSRPRLAAGHLGRCGPEGHLCRDTETASVARAVRTWKPGLSTSHWSATWPVWTRRTVLVQHSGFHAFLREDFLSRSSSTWTVVCSGWFCITIRHIPQLPVLQGRRYFPVAVLERGC